MNDRYIVISPVHNEEKHIDGLVESVARQTIRPQLWLFVDDSSTDATAQMIKRYESMYDFIKYKYLPRGELNTYYTRKTLVFLAGYEALQGMEDYDFIANLDADIILTPVYYEGILREFHRNPQLGLAGGVYAYERNGRIERVLFDTSSVPGSIQMFRRACYEQIGGYTPLTYGGDDTLAGIMARMHGWMSMSFPEHQVIQRRTVGTAETNSILKARFRQGLTEYGVATHPLFMLVKSCRRAVRERPYVIGSLVRLAGFFYGCCRGHKRQMPREAVRFVRREQMKRLLHRGRRSCHA